MRRVLITHNDLDGAGCAMLIKSAFPETVVYYEDYTSIGGRITDLIAGDKVDVLHITDISPENPAIINMLNEFYQDHCLYLIDHHKTAIEKLIDMVWAKVDTTFCATKLVYQELTSMGYDLSKYNQMVDIIDGYDRWLHTDPRSMKFNTLFQAIGREEFVDRARNLPYPEVIHGTDRAIIDVWERQEMKYAEDAIAKSEILTGIYGTTLLIFAERCQSLIGELVRQREFAVDYVSIVDLHNRKVSLRTVNDGCDVSKIAKFFGGGGHTKSAGYEIEYNDIMRIVEQVI